MKNLVLFTAFLLAVSLSSGIYGQTPVKKSEPQKEQKTMEKKEVKPVKHEMMKKDSIKKEATHMTKGTKAEKAVKHEMQESKTKSNAVKTESKKTK